MGAMQKRSTARNAFGVTTFVVIVAVFASSFAITPIEARIDKPQLVTERIFDLQNGTRDVAYSSKFGPGSLSAQLFITGMTATPAHVADTGLDFFALALNKVTGLPIATFGIDGFVSHDSGNFGGSSRTDVATEILVLDDPPRVALLGESVVSAQGQATNLQFAIAMLDAHTGQLQSNFAHYGWGKYDIDSGANDEIFFGDVDFPNQDLIVGGFANPTPTTGAGPAFNCALLKLDQYGNRITSFGQNGQVIIDFNGWDERCRAGLALRNGRQAIQQYIIGGRSKPAPALGAVPTPDQTNFRHTLTVLDATTGLFEPTFGDYTFGLGRQALNLNNGSFATIRAIEYQNSVVAIGNWGGWDQGVSGNQAIGLVRWSRNLAQSTLDQSWAHGGLSYVLPPVAGGSYDVYSLINRGNDLYVVGGVKAHAGSAALPQAIVAKFRLHNGELDDSFGTDGIYTHPLGSGVVGSVFKSVHVDGQHLVLVGDAIAAPGASTDYNILFVRLKL